MSQACMQKVRSRKARKIFRITLGIILVILGLIGGLIPVVQGWMFGIPGLLILSEYFPWLRRLVEWAKRKAGWKDRSGNDSPQAGEPGV